MNKKTFLIHLPISVFVLALAAAVSPFSVMAQTNNTMAEGGNSGGYDMAPETRLEVVEAAIAMIPTKIPSGPFQPTWDSLKENYKVPRWFVEAKFGVKPQSIPDYLAVVGDSADGFPGVPGWGIKAAALTLSQYPHLEDIPKDWRAWHPTIKKARALSPSLFNAWNDALLFRTLATLRLDVPVFDTVEDLRWTGPRPNFEEHCQRMKSPDLLRRVTTLKVPSPKPSSQRSSR